MTVETINERIQIIVDQYYSGNVTRFSKMVGVTQSTIRDIVKGRMNKPSNDTIAKILKVDALNINPDWLITGNGNMVLTDGPLPREAKIKKVEDFMNVPLVPIRGKAGYLTGYGDMEYIETLATIPVIVDRAYKGKYRCFEVDGDSMDDGTRDAICDKDIVLGRDIKRELWECKLHINAWNFIIVHKEGITIKRIVDHDIETGIIKCHSLNSLYDDFEIHLNNVIELYNLIKIVDRSTRL